MSDIKLQEIFQQKLNDHEKKLAYQLQNFEDIIEKKMQTMQNQLALQDSRNKDNHDLATAQKILNEKLSKIEIDLGNNKDNIFTNNVKIINFEKSLTTACQKYDKIFFENLTLPGFIGEGNKYRNLREYLDENMRNVTNLMERNEKSKIELKGYKDSIDQNIQLFNINTESFEKRVRERTEKAIESVKKLLEDEMAGFNKKIDDVKVENGKYNLNMINQTKDLKKECDDLLLEFPVIKQRIKEKLEEYVTANEVTIGKFKDLKKEFDHFQYKFSELSEFIRVINLLNFNLFNFKQDVRFRRNVGAETQKYEFRAISDLLDYNHISETPHKDERILANMRAEVDAPDEFRETKDVENTKKEEKLPNYMRSRTVKIDSTKQESINEGPKDDKSKPETKTDKTDY